MADSASSSPSRPRSYPRPPTPHRVSMPPSHASHGYLDRPLPPVPTSPCMSESLYGDRPLSLPFSECEFVTPQSFSAPLPPVPAAISHRMSTSAVSVSRPLSGPRRKRASSDPIGLITALAPPATPPPRFSSPQPNQTSRVPDAAPPTSQYLQLLEFLDAAQQSAIGDDTDAYGDDEDGYGSDITYRGPTSRRPTWTSTYTNESGIVDPELSSSSIVLPYLSTDTIPDPPLQTPTSSSYPHDTLRAPILLDTRLEIPDMPRMPQVSTSSQMESSGIPDKAGDAVTVRQPISNTGYDWQSALLTTEQIIDASGCILRDEVGQTVCFDDLLPQWDPSIPVELRDHARRPRLVVLFIGHWWCGLCQDYTNVSVSQLAPAALEEANVRVILISTGGWRGIKRYRELFRCPFPVYVTRGALAKTLGLRTSIPNPLKELRFKDRPDYHRRPFYRQMISGFRNGMFRISLTNPGKFMQLGGEFVLGPDYTCEFAHRMTGRADHCEASDVVRAAGVERPTHRAIRAELEARQFAIETFLDEQAWLERRRLKLQHQRMQEEQKQESYGRKQDMYQESEMHLPQPATPIETEHATLSSRPLPQTPLMPGLTPTSSANESHLASVESSPVSSSVCSSTGPSLWRPPNNNKRWSPSVCSLELEDDDEIDMLGREFEHAMSIDPTGGRQALAKLLADEQARAKAGALAHHSYAPTPTPIA